MQCTVSCRKGWNTAVNTNREMEKYKNKYMLNKNKGWWMLISNDKNKWPQTQANANE